MGKLYYITGNDAEIRRKVYSEIFQWSNSQQIYPLQAYPVSNEEAPNFYLYDYLGHGDQEALQLCLEQYGQDVVEPIYLRAPQETEDMLLQQGIYQSYAPYGNLAGCLQEIVETVFTGYHKTTYDFKAVLEAEKAKEEEQKRAEQEPTPLKEKKKGKGVFFKKIMRPILLMAAWILFVCLITVGMFHGIANLASMNNNGGNLIPVNKEDQDPTPKPSPGVTLRPTTTPERVEQNAFYQPMPDDYVIDLSAPVKLGGNDTYHINYTSETEIYYNYFAGVGSDTKGDYYTTSMDGSIGAILLDSGLWYLNQTGVGQVASGVSYSVLSATGNYLFYCRNDAIYCLDTKNNTQEKLLNAYDVNGMAASPNGQYCAYLKDDGTITIINRKQKTTKDIVGLEYNTLYTVSNDGGWVCGRSYLDNNQNYLLCMGTNGAIKWITDEKTDCYIPFSGENIIYEMMNQLWYFDSTLGYPMQKLPMSGDWRLLFTKKNCLYEVADGIYMYDESAPCYVLIGDSLCQITYDDNRQKYTTELISQDLLYAEGNVFLQQSDVSTPLLNEIQYVVSATQDGKILYVNNDDELYYYSPEAMAVMNLDMATPYVGEFVRGSFKVKGLTVTNGDTLYYYTSSGELWYVKMDDTFFTQKQIKLFTATGHVKFEVNNAGVYMYYYASTNVSIADVYFVKEDICQFLGTKEGGVAG